MGKTNRKPMRILEHIYSLIEPSVLIEHEIRYAPYCASVVDKNGKFPGEDTFIENDTSCPFVVKGVRLECLPIINTDSSDEAKNIISTMSINIENVIRETKEKMAYVCFVGYVQNQEKDGVINHLPIMRGLTNERYYRFFNNL
jgi:hypothetical protein